MEELTTSTQETEPTQSTSARKWYEGVSLEDAEIYIRANLKSAARSVIAIGYYLKCVYTKELYQEAGFKDVYEYAKDRFGFSTSTTSRYMSRNDKFSVDGNSPILDEKYKDFNKSQLQEMLSLDAEQLEQVTPDMTVVQIREMRKPKEIPYIEMPGQIELTDFPGVDPKDVAASVRDRAAMESSQPEKQTYTISAEDLLPEPAQPEREQPVAISQQENRYQNHSQKYHRKRKRLRRAAVYRKNQRSPGSVFTGQNLNVPWRRYINLPLVQVRIAAVNVVGSVSSMGIVSGSATARYIGRRNLKRPRTMEPWRLTIKLCCKA